MHRYDQSIYVYPGNQKREKECCGWLLENNKPRRRVECNFWKQAKYLYNKHMNIIKNNIIQGKKHYIKPITEYKIWANKETS